MRKNVAKNIIKMVATAAMVIGIATTAKVDANAMTLKEYAAWLELPVSVVKADPDLMACYEELKNDTLPAANSGKESYTKASTTPVAGVATSHKDMLDLVNADRKANGAGNLVWNADLEVIAQQRAVEVMGNYLSPEYAAAIAANDYATECTVAHKGMRAGTSENACWAEMFGCSSVELNECWIASAGHHANRIKAGWTQYAAASYIDPTTGQEAWVEVFADNNFKGASSFDYVQYAADYPDLTAAFGQDKNALYNHYITYGKAEGRKAYYTDGTPIEM